MKPLIVLIVSLALSPYALGAQSPSSCRKSCGATPDNWCLSLGDSGGKTAAPYVAILRTAETQVDGHIGGTCDLNIATTSAGLTILGNSCEITQNGFTDLVLKTTFPLGVSASTITADGGLVEVHFDSVKPHFSFSTASTTLSGDIEFITSTIDQNGDTKVVWYNGEECFAAYTK